MKRLFLWLWFVTSACFLVSVFVLNHILDGISLPVQDRVFAEQVRGQVYACLLYTSLMARGGV